MEGRLTGLLTVVLCLVSCGHQATPTEVDAPTAHLRFAWTGEADGLSVLFEELTPPEQPSDAVLTEEGMLRQRLHLPEDKGLMRLWLIGLPALREDPGEVVTDVGRFVDFGPPPPEFGPGQRLLWQCLLRGGEPTAGDSGAESEIGVTRWVLQGPLNTPPSALLWHRQGQRLELQPRRWTAKERRAWLDDALGVGSTEQSASLPADHPPVSPTSEQPQR